VLILHQPCFLSFDACQRRASGEGFDL